MTTWLEIILPVRNPGGELTRTVASLLAQTERGFGVVLGGDGSLVAGDALAAAQRQLEAGGIPTRRCAAPFAMAPVALWNWTLAQAAADWCLPLRTGDCLVPECAGLVAERARRGPGAQLIRWSFAVAPLQAAAAAFTGESLTPEQFVRRLAAGPLWLGGRSNAAFRRAAWQAAGGFAVHLPVWAHAHLCVMLALHHGLENLPANLVTLAAPPGGPASRFARVFEWWLVLRQARLFCHNAKLPWPDGGIEPSLWQQFWGAD